MSLLAYTIGALAAGGPLEPLAFALGMACMAALKVATVLTNDIYDRDSDARNLNWGPFTGGSRFIQNGVLTARETAGYGAALIGIVIAAGLWLTSISAPSLIWIWGGGLFIGWAYSAPPIALNSGGLGELCVALGFGLIVVGADFVQRESLAPLRSTLTA